MEGNLENKLEINREVFADRFKEITGNEQNKLIAEKIYTNPSKISNLMNRKADPTLTDLLNISSAYNCSIDYLLNLSEEPYLNSKSNMSTETNTTLSDFISKLFSACEDEDFYITADSDDSFATFASVSFKNPEIIQFLLEWKSIRNLRKMSPSASKIYNTWKSGKLNDTKEQLKKYDYKPYKQIADETIAILEDEMLDYNNLLGSDYEPDEPHSTVSFEKASIMFEQYPNNKHIRELYDFWLSSDVGSLPFN